MHRIITTRMRTAREPPLFGLQLGHRHTWPEEDLTALIRKPNAKTEVSHFKFSHRMIVLFAKFPVCTLIVILLNSSQQLELAVSTYRSEL